MSTLRDGGRFPKFLKVLWGLLTFASMTLAWGMVSIVTRRETDYELEFLFLLIGLACLVLFLICVSGTFWWIFRNRN